VSAYAAAHNRLIDYAIIADLRGADNAARSLRFAASLLARLINAELTRKHPYAGSKPLVETGNTDSIGEADESRITSPINPEPHGLQHD
jgi:hypothetical protein